METFAKASVGAGARTLERQWYVDPAVFALEQSRIFGTDWICVGRAEAIPSAGEYFTRELAAESLIVTRGSDDQIRAFYNVCRHRGTRLCSGSSGHFNGSIQCPYHAWTYALDGSLRVARNMGDAPGFRADDYPLHQARVATWNGFIFVSMDNDGSAFEEAFAPLLSRFDRWQIDTLKTAVTIEYDVAANWKLIVQNYSECYHCPLVHPQLDKLSPSDSGRNDLDEGPFLGGYSELRGEADLTTSGKRSRPPIGSVDGDDLHRVYYYAIFPSLLLSLHPDYVMMHSLEPVTTGRTKIRCSWLFDPAVMESPGFDPSDAVDFWDLTNRQDWNVNELTQQGVMSKTYSPGPYSNAEGLLAAFDRYYLSRMREMK